MTAKEFRIGNQVHEFGLPILITGAIIEKLQQIELNGKICIDITPIPLTEEWLNKFKVYQRGMNSFECYNDGTDLDCSYDVKYVHQLQNLYFAITGNELTQTF